MNEERKREIKQLIKLEGLLNDTKNPFDTDAKNFREWNEWVKRTQRQIDEAIDDIIDYEIRESKTIPE